MLPLPPPLIFPRLITSNPVPLMYQHHPTWRRAVAVVSKICDQIPLSWRSLLFSNILLGMPIYSIVCNKTIARGPIFLPSLLHTKEKTYLNFDKYGELLKYQLRSWSISNDSAMFVGFCNINVYHLQPPFHIYNVTLNAFIRLFV